ncbi:MAG: hypothetical protein VX776_08195, partial [Planctomycetota bacterium]|nr:hypothetical protein [Planctomycetota bacterium]
TYIPVAGQHFTGSTIYYVRQFKHLLRLLPKVAQLRKLRKSPEKLLQSIGCEGMTLEQIQNRLSADLGIRVVIGVSPYPELGMDVDKLSDLKLAQKLLE